MKARQNTNQNIKNAKLYEPRYRRWKHNKSAAAAAHVARPWIGSGHKYTYVRQKLQNRVQSNTTYHCLFLIQVQFAGCVMNAWMNGIAMDVRVDHGLDIAYG